MALKAPIYLDAQATTPCDPRVVEVMVPCFAETFGNASSRTHAFGWKAEALVDRARTQVAELINADPTEIVFTSGATESDNLALIGVAEAYEKKGRHIVTAATEHRAVLDTCTSLKQCGFDITVLPVENDGRVNPDELRRALREDTILASIMYANNEIGTLNPITEIAEMCRSQGVLYHCDAVQAMAYLPIDVEALQIDLLSISAHKMYGPKGIGALYVRRRNPRVRLALQMHGGGHERGRRSGTLNVPGIVGLGQACEIARREQAKDAERLLVLRDRLLKGLRQRIPDLHLNGSIEHRLPNNLNVSFSGVDADALMSSLKGVAVSSASACSSESLEPSYVLAALGVGEKRAHESIRLGLTRFTTEEEIDFAITALAEAVEMLRSG